MSTATDTTKSLIGMEVAKASDEDLLEMLRHAAKITLSGKPERRAGHVADMAMKALSFNVRDEYLPVYQRLVGIYNEHAEELGINPTEKMSTAQMNDVQRWIDR